MGKHIRFDWAMKRLLRNKANYGVLEGFLSELLLQDIKISEILESEGNKDDETDKFNKVDILVKNQMGELMFIEVQNERENDFFHRMNYGQAKLITQYLDESEAYEKIKKIYSINIVYFDLGQGQDYVYKGKTEFRGIHYHDLLELNNSQKKAYPIGEVADIYTTYFVLKVNNFDNVAKDTLDEWIYFLKNSEIKAEFKAKGLGEAMKKLNLDNLSPSEREAYDQYIKLKRVRDNELETAIYEGYVKAEKQYQPIIEEERKQKEKAEKVAEEERKQKEEAQNKLINIVLKLHKKGKSIAEIAEDIDLTENEVKRIIEENKK